MVPDELAGLPQCTVVQRCRVHTRGLRFAADIVQTLACIARSRSTFDVILAYQTVIDGLIAVIAKVFFGIPVIVSVRSDVEYRLDRSVQSRLLTPFVFRHADRIAVQSPAMQHELMEAFAHAERRPRPETLRSRLVLLPNGISVVEQRRREGEEVVFVGRLTRHRAIDVLIDAMRDCPGERLTIVGDGPDRSALERRARGLANVSFVGAVPHADVKTHLERARMLVLPSRHEGQPNIVMEAMAFGVPVIATRVGGVPDLISHGHNGWLVEPGDPASVARAIQRLSSDPALRGRLAANALREIRRYAWPDVMNGCEQMLQEVATARRKQKEVPRRRFSWL
jgi:glycosyltransferase involved in cell wall biosynthesis